MASPQSVFALDATPLVSRPTGIGRFVRELAAGVAAHLEDGETLLLHAGVARLNPVFGVSHADLRAAAALARTRLVRQCTPLSLTYALWQRGLGPPVESFTGPVSVYHGTNYLVPRVRDAARVVTVHDLSLLGAHAGVPARVVERFGRALRFALANADAVVVDSVATRSELVRRTGFDKARTTVAPLGVSHAFRPADDPQRARTRAAAAAPADAPFLLFVGTSNPRKNLVRTLEAFARARRAEGLPHRLVLAGDAGHDAQGVDAAIDRLGLGGVVLSPGYVDEELLLALYQSAAGLLFPSLDEGFGLPVLEAQACACPVLAGDRGSLPEVSGRGALLVDPLDVDALTAGIARLVTDEALRRELVAEGRENARGHAWEQCARSYLDLYRQLEAR